MSSQPAFPSWVVTTADQSLYVRAIGAGANDSVLIDKDVATRFLETAQSDTIPSDPRFISQLEDILNTPSENLLAALTGKEYFRSFGRPIPNQSHRPSHVFIRRAYREVTYQVLNDLRTCIEKHGRYHQIITGTPGIGKSIFLSYLVHFLAHVDGITHIVIDYTQGADPSQIFHFTRTGSISSSNTSMSTVGEWQWSNRVPITSATLYLSDPQAGDKALPRLQCHHIVICSPNINYVKDLISKDAFPVMVMPVFSLEELIALNNLMPDESKFSEEELNIRYRKYGGVPRHVFGSEIYLKTMDQIMRHKISDLKVDHLFIISEKIDDGQLFFKANSIPNTLLHMVAAESDVDKKPRIMDLESVENIHNDDILPVKPTLNYAEHVRKFGSQDYEQQFIGAAKNMGRLVSIDALANDIQRNRLREAVKRLNNYMLEAEDKQNSVSLLESTIDSTTTSSNSNLTTLPLFSSRSSEHRLESSEDKYLEGQDAKEKAVPSEASSRIPKTSRKPKRSVEQTEVPGNEEREQAPETAVQMPKGEKRKKTKSVGGKKKKTSPSSSAPNLSVKMGGDDNDEEED